MSEVPHRVSHSQCEQRGSSYSAVPGWEQVTLLICTGLEASETDVSELAASPHRLFEAPFMALFRNLSWALSVVLIAAATLHAGCTLLTMARFCRNDYLNYEQTYSISWIAEELFHL